MAFSALELAEITDWPDALIEDYTSLVTSLVALSDALASNLPEYMIVGSGAPEGAVTSNKARQYLDTGGLFYVNPVVGVNTGWVSNQRRSDK